jgi:EAL domain-containing protein (putative c-di-GMP-specific phosphodiesterase class I)
MISSALAQTGLPADRLALEITEGTVMDNPEAAAATLRELAAMGIGISIDDFGTGYSSLGYLNRFPVRDLKIDRSFVRELDTGGDGAAIVTAIIGLAHSLGVKVVAEGVETAEQLAFLIAQGCDAAQGFYLSRPIPIAPFGALLAERRTFVTVPVARSVTTVRGSQGDEPRDRKSTGPARKTRGATPKSARRPPRKSSARRKRSR